MERSENQGDGRTRIQVSFRHVLSQDFQDPEVPGQEIKAELAHSPVDLDENWS